MNSPLKSPITNNKCLATLKGIIPEGSVVHSFLLYDGNIELALSDSNRFVVAHTGRYVNYEFWQCMLSDPERVATIAEHFSPIESDNIFNILQENWPKYPDPFLRSGMFFILNRSSDMSYVSSGKLIDDRGIQRTITKMKKFTAKNMHVQFDKDDRLTDSLSKVDSRCDYVFLPIGSISMNIFEEGKSEGFEQTKVIHKEVKEFIDNTDKKVILLYKYSKAVTDFYKDNSVYIIDQWGRNTDVTTFAKEVLIANF